MGIRIQQFFFSGPLIVVKDGRRVLAGVTSWGFGCGANGFPGIYARVTSQLSWIHEHIEGGGHSLCDFDARNSKCTL